MEWPRGEAAACKAVHTGSNPVSTSHRVVPDGAWHRAGCTEWAIGAAVARFPDTEEVTGSIPVSPTTYHRRSEAISERFGMSFLVPVPQRRRSPDGGERGRTAGPSYGCSRRLRVLASFAVPSVRADGSERRRPAADAEPPDFSSAPTPSVQDDTEEVMNALDAVACVGAQGRPEDDPRGWPRGQRSPHLVAGGPARRAQSRWVGGRTDRRAGRDYSGTFVSCGVRRTLRVTCLTDSSHDRRARSRACSMLPKCEDERWCGLLAGPRSRLSRSAAARRTRLG